MNAAWMQEQTSGQNQAHWSGAKGRTDCVETVSGSPEPADDPSRMHCVFSVAGRSDPVGFQLLADHADAGWMKQSFSLLCFFVAV